MILFHIHDVVHYLYETTSNFLTNNDHVIKIFGEVFIAPYNFSTNNDHDIKIFREVFIVYNI